MGCGGSKTTVVEPINCNELERAQGDSGSKHGTRGDSAVSKVTADSGVEMDSRQDRSLPGAVPSKIPPLTVGSPGLLQEVGSPVERPRSSEILEQLLVQGIISSGQTRERSPGSGEAYNIMLDESEVPRRRPPARLESLKARKEQSSTSRESISEKMRQAEERRKQLEGELKTRLRTKSARVHAPAPASDGPEENAITQVDQHQDPFTTDPPGRSGSWEEGAKLQAQNQVREARRGVAVGDEPERGGQGDGGEAGGEGGDAGERRERDEEGVRRRGDGEEGRLGREREGGDGSLLLVEELKVGQHSREFE